MSTYIEKTINIGTVCEYPKVTKVPFHESDLWNGYPEGTNAPYGIAKRALLTMGQAYRKQYDANITHLLLANMYGEGDNFDLETSHVIPAIVRKMSESDGSSVTLWGTGQATREFLFVGDAVDAIIASIDRYDEPEPLNIGNGIEVSIDRLADMIANLIGFEGVINWDETKPDGQPRRVLDVRRANKLLNWKAEMSMHEGLLRVINDWNFQSEQNNLPDNWRDLSSAAYAD